MILHHNVAEYAYILLGGGLSVWDRRDNVMFKNS